MTTLTHPEHTSVAEATFNPCARTIEVAMRVDSTHLEEALHDSLGRRVNLETTPDAATLLQGYLADHFRVRIKDQPDATPLSQKWVGLETEGLDVWLYLEVQMPEDLGPEASLPLQVQHNVMQKLLPRQINLVTFQGDHGKKTLRFTSDDQGWQTLDLPYVDVEGYESQVGCWHQRRLDRLRAPGGWLTLVGLHWLEQGEQTIADLGVFTYRGSRVTYQPLPGLTTKGLPEDGVLLSDADDEGPSTINVGSMLFRLIKRGDRLGIRVRDFDAPLREQLTSLPRFPIDPAWRLTARYQPAADDASVAIDSVIGVTSDEAIAGHAIFEHAGHSCRMVLLPGGSDDSFFVVFGDETNGQITYGGGRFLSARLNSAGDVLLDFNQAYSPPCSFTPYATCPLPVADNRLPFAVTAGEKKVAIK